jgi:hypothetical protein
MENNVGFEVLTAIVMKSSVCWHTRITPCRSVKVNPRFGEHTRIASETSADFHRTIRRYVPESRSLYRKEVSKQYSRYAFHVQRNQRMKWVTT